MNTKQELNILPVGRELHEENIYRKNPSRYVVSVLEFEQMKQEKFKDVEGLSYEEYCELESECWNEMFKEQLKPLWEKSIPDSIIDKNTNAKIRPNNKSTAFLRLVYKNIPVNAG